MSPGTFQKLVETVGIPDAVLFAGDFVDNPHRASEWFDRQNEERPVFFPGLQGTCRSMVCPKCGGDIRASQSLGIPTNIEGFSGIRSGLGASRRDSIPIG